jgi:transposase
MPKTTYPAWVDKHRKSGTEIRKIGDSFYVYETTCVYDKIKKKPKKKTGKYLGTISETEGFKEALSVKILKSASNALQVNRITTREYGMCAFIQEHCKHITDGLKIYFPSQWQHILVALYCRLVYTSPIKNMPYYFKRSFLSIQMNITVNPKNISALLNDIGKDRKQITDYMQHLAGGEKLLLVDATSIISYSRNLSQVETGLTKDKTFGPIFNLLYFYSPHDFLPAYYRLFNGNIKDVKMVSLAVKESRYKDALVIGDKGFFSDDNLEIMENEALMYIIPLKRNSSLIYNELYKTLTTDGNHFLYEGRVIYYTSYELTPSRSICLYTDELMMANEKRDFVCRMESHPQTYTKEKFQEKLPMFGTLSLITNTKETPQNIYLNYKSRAGIEILFDGLKNILGNDHTYMHSDDALEGWMFINHLALQVHHKIYSFLKSKNLLKKYSIRDFIAYLSDLKKVNINGQWHLEELTSEHLKLIKQTGIHIP